MKKSICVVSVLIATLFSVSVCMAGPDIPNLVGTWMVKSEGGMLLKGKEPGPKTHHKGDFSALSGEAVIAKQQGRIDTVPSEWRWGHRRNSSLGLVWITRPYISWMKMVLWKAR